MNEKSIRKLRVKFIASAMLTLAIVILLIGGLIYLINLTLTHRQIYHSLAYIIENDGEIPEQEESSSETTVFLDETEHHEYRFTRFLQEIFSGSRQDAGAVYASSRFFAILYDEDGTLTEVKTHNIDMITRAEAERYGDAALASGRDYNRVGDYFYRIGTSASGHSIIVYLDAASQMDSIRRLMYSALSLIFIGFLITLIFVRIISERAIRPEIQNADLQKRFITNASHELKTPLAVIKANTEMEELLNGENEWTQSTLRQVDRLNGLVQNLVMITRAQEKEQAERVKVDVTKAISETVETFLPVAERENKRMTSSIDPDITLLANDSEIRQLATLLLDNAIKYCDENGSIEVIASRKGRWLTFAVSNNYAAGKGVDYNRFFERFYREDASHNVDQGGYGIGLSIAKSLVERYNGAIRAEWKDGVIRFVCQLKE